MNLYGFTGNNPVNAVDPLGLNLVWIPDIWERGWGYEESNDWAPFFIGVISMIGRAIGIDDIRLRTNEGILDGNNRWVFYATAGTVMTAQDVCEKCETKADKRQNRLKIRCAELLRRAIEVIDAIDYAENKLKVKRREFEAEKDDVQYVGEAVKAANSVSESIMAAPGDIVESVYGITTDGNMFENRTYVTRPHETDSVDLYQAGVATVIGLSVADKVTDEILDQNTRTKIYGGTSTSPVDPRLKAGKKLVGLIGVEYIFEAAPGMIGERIDSIEAKNLGKELNSLETDTEIETKRLYLRLRNISNLRDDINCSKYNY